MSGPVPVPQELVGPAEAVTVGAVDLGSNSFHMVIARAQGHELTVIDRLREPVRLAEGLLPDGTLEPNVQARAVDCLKRFGERLRELPAGQVRAVGTNTLRKASRDLGFRARAKDALGHAIEIVSGQEEARLIYQGICHAQPYAGRRLAVDIGGGSTEIIVGAGLEVLRAHSLYMGCVSYSRRFFPDGALTRDAFREAETAVALELRGAREELRGMHWETSIGSSGTINAISELLRGSQGGPEITLPRLKQLRKLVMQAGRTEALALDGLKPDRAAVLPGGLAILIGVFRNLGVDTMLPSSGALREGLLWDLLGRLRHEDMRDRTIQTFVERYRVDVAQAARVERTALALLDQIGVPVGVDAEGARSLLSWASWLHEIGLAVSYSSYHKHGAYVVANADMPGFSKDDQSVLAALIEGHRRKLRDRTMAAVPESRNAEIVRLTILLRLAVLLHRSRHDESAPPARIEWAEPGARLVFPGGWFAEHPLMRADLKREQRYVEEAGLRLEIEEAR